MQREQIEQIVVTAEQMRQIENLIFAAGMPSAALMEKAALLTAKRIQELYPHLAKVGVLVGPGHNGGDAIVVARELHLAGYQVCVYCPFSQLKDLTAQHAQYAQHLGINFSEQIQTLENSDLIIDGLFGFGLTRSLVDQVAIAINLVNQWHKPIVSIDIPSGLHTDTGEVLGTAIIATHTLCLGLWKLVFFQDRALEYLGNIELIDFGIPLDDAYSIISQSPLIEKMSSTLARGFLPLPRPLVTHKYKQGHLLIICGSSCYAGGAILTGLGARATGVGMLSIAVPQSLKPLLVNHLPEALIIGCEETANGAISSIPEMITDFNQYQAIACGPGLTKEPVEIVQNVLKAQCPLILDADALNIIAQIGTISSLKKRLGSTVITPHLGEFKRLFPHISTSCPIKAAQEAARESEAIVLFKGARTAIANPDGHVWLIGESTPALARGGSGDVLTGLIGGLMAQTKSSQDLLGTAAMAAWWHAIAGREAAIARTELGVDGLTLSSYLQQVCLSVMS